MSARFVSFKGFYLPGSGRYFLCDFYQEGTSAYFVLVEDTGNRISKEVQFYRDKHLGNWLLWSDASLIPTELRDQLSEYIGKLSETEPSAIALG